MRVSKMTHSEDEGPFGYPRPQLRRKTWQSLNGPWQFAIDFEGDQTDPGGIAWDATINVPFAPETSASGINNNELFRACWYRRMFDVPPIANGDRLLLHFGAVDYRTTVWINDRQLDCHEGGYTPFTFDITMAVTGRPQSEIVVRAEDDPHDLGKPRGKQDWERQPHSIWYPRTSGIWQTVWLERVPKSYIDRVRWTPNLERWEIGCAVWTAGRQRENMFLRVRLHNRGVTLADDAYLVINGETHRRIALSDPGIDDHRNSLLWHPDSPTLIGAELTLVSSANEVIDEVHSYTALRSIGVDEDRFVLNGRPYYLRLVLDQGYWPETGMTARDDDALRKDVRLARQMGFNGVRKHQKLEDPRYLYWADRLGLLVWEEMPSCYRFTQDSISRATREWMAALTRDYSHPCIVTWVPFNESWGVPNLPAIATERHYVDSMYHLTKTFDPTRPGIGNDGWESVATDIIGIHDYDADPEQLARRYGSARDTRPRLLKHERPGGRVLVIGSERHVDQPIMLTEFGGIALSEDTAKTWGYSRADGASVLAEKYRALVAAVKSVGVFSGFCYTQFADTYQEANGLLYADRTPKFAIEEIAAATRGKPSP